MEGSRADRWKHRTGECLDLEARDVAVLAELLLRGPQTDGELRQRASRMVQIGDLNEAESIIGKMSSREEPLIQRLGPPGKRRGVKYAHTLYAADEQPERPPEPSAWSGGYSSAPQPVTARPSAPEGPATAVATETLPVPESIPTHSLLSPSMRVSESIPPSAGLESDLRERIRKLEERVEELEATFVKFLR